MDTAKKELYVYYDTRYDPDCTRKFINESISEQIVEFLKCKDFKILDAQGLQKIMLSVVKREVKNVVIVFAQDVAPDTILDDPAATALVRQYLDNGGTIIWIGDIPFFYQAKGGGHERDDKWWEKGAAASILGVNPVFPGHTPIGKITRLGKGKGLKVAWTGIRPILADGKAKVLAGFKCQIGRAHMPVLSNWFSRQWHKLSRLQLGAQGLTVGVEFKDHILREEGTIVWNKKLANAWFKNFDSSNHNSGFFRIWDYRPAILNNQQLEDLYEIAASAIK